MRAVMVGCLLALALTSCGSGDTTAEATAPADEAGLSATESEPTLTSPAAPESVVTEVEPTSSGSGIAELVAAEWSEFCMSETPLYGSPSDSWADYIDAILDALRPLIGDPDTPPTDQPALDAVLLASNLSWATSARSTLSLAIDEAMGSQTAVDCGTGICTVLKGEEGAFVVNFDSGGSGRLEVDEELAAFRATIEDLAGTARVLGLDACSLLTGDDT